MRDASPICQEWTDRKLYEEIDSQLIRAFAEKNPAQRGYMLATAGALLDILSLRAAKEPRL